MELNLFCLAALNTRMSVLQLLNKRTISLNLVVSICSLSILKIDAELRKNRH